MLDQATIQKITNLFKSNKQTILFQTAELSKQQAIIDLIKSKFKKANLVIYQPTDGKIKIETIRNINQSLTTKRFQRQFIIIQQANKMNSAAQNAFLKALEEPNRGVYFILFSDQPKQLLATVRSRAILFKLTKTTKSDLAKQLLQIQSDLDQQIIKQICFLTTDLTEAKQLINQPKLFAKQQTLVSDAKKLINDRLEQKMLVVKQYSTDREQAIELLTMMTKIYQTIIASTSNSDLVQQAQNCLEAIAKIKANQSIKLVLTDIALENVV